MDTITVYTTPGEPQCNATIEALDRRGVIHRRFDVTTDPWARIELREMGYRHTPVVVAGDRRWQGHRPDLIDQLD